LGRGPSLLILGKIIAKIANFGSKKAWVSSDFWTNYVWKRPFIEYIYMVLVYGEESLDMDY
jgi:hypothetical protein